jgi:hypothetical protein
MKPYGCHVALAATALWVATPLPCGAADENDPVLRFTDATREAGIRLELTCGEAPSREILEVNGGGVAFLDYDDDGDLDLFFANGATMKDPEHGPGSRLYSNDGRGKFTDVTRRLGIELRRWANGAAVGDYDGDGDDDLYVTCFGRNVLLRNDARGDGRRFVDVTSEAGVGDPRWGASAAFGDVDGDGDLDLYVANYIEFDVADPPARAMFKGAPIFGGPSGMGAPTDVLYENLGQGKFDDVTRKSGCIPAQPGYSMGVVMLDVDRDGKQDIYVGNDSTANFLFHNLGQGKFEEIGVISGLASNYDGRNQATMGIAVADVDGNGHADFFTTNFSSDTNTLHLNLGRTLFDDRTSQFGLAAISRPFLSWGTGFYDFDSDGDEDLFIASGHIYPEATTHEIDSDYQQPPLLFARSGKRFERRIEAGDMFETRYSGRGTAFGDIDDDGDVDIVMSTLNEPVRVFRNDAPRRDVVVVELRGKPGNLRGLGSLVELVSGEAVQRRWIHGGSYQTVDAPLAYFGLGESFDRKRLVLRVTWDDGTVSEHHGVPANRRIVITEGKEAFGVAKLSGRSR